MKTVKKIDLTKEGEPRYTTYFYHKDSEFVWEVVTNGKHCPLSIADECGIHKDMKSDSKLPKYILDKL